MTWFAVENMQYRERARLSDVREGSEGRGRGRRAGEERGRERGERKGRKRERKRYERGGRRERLSGYTEGGER